MNNIQKFTNFFRKAYDKMLASKLLDKSLSDRVEETIQKGIYKFKAYRTPKKVKSTRTTRVRAILRRQNFGTWCAMKPINLGNGRFVSVRPALSPKGRGPNSAALAAKRRIQFVNAGDLAASKVGAV